MINFKKLLFGKKAVAKNVIALSLMVIIGTLSLIFIAGIVIADTQSDLQNELNQLESDLSSMGYDWLIDYSGEVDNVFYNILNKFKYVNKYTTM